MGFWRGVGYFISVLFVIGGIIMIPVTYGASLVSTILGFIFIWMLRRRAGQERIEKQLKEINQTNKERSLMQSNNTANMCSKCNAVNAFENIYCSRCGNKL